MVERTTDLGLGAAKRVGRMSTYVCEEYGTLLNSAQCEERVYVSTQTLNLPLLEETTDKMWSPGG